MRRGAISSIGAGRGPPLGLRFFVGSASGIGVGSSCEVSLKGLLSA